MDKIWQFVKAHPRDVIIGAIIVLLAVCGVPLLINWTFSEPAWLNCFAVDWEAKDALSYYGSTLGFVGTVVLGAISVYQTRKAHIQTEKANNQTEKANQLAEEALAQTKKANELAAKMQKLEEARFLSMVTVDGVRFQTIKSTDLSESKTPFMFPDTPKATKIDLTNGSKTSEYYIIDTIITNASDFHIGKISAFANYLDNTWKINHKRNGIGPNCQMHARILIPCTNQKPAVDYDFKIHIYFTNIFEYTTHLTLAIKDITNADGKHSYNYDIEKVSQEII